MAQLGQEIAETLRAELGRLDAEQRTQMSVRAARFVLTEFVEHLGPDEFEAADLLVLRLEEGLEGRQLTKDSYGTIRKRFFGVMYAAESSSGRLLRHIHLAERAAFQREIEHAGLVVRHRNQPGHLAVVYGLLEFSPDPVSSARWAIGQARELLGDADVGHAEGTNGHSVPSGEA